MGILDHFLGHFWSAYIKHFRVGTFIIRFSLGTSIISPGTGIWH